MPETPVFLVPLMLLAALGFALPKGAIDRPLPKALVLGGLAALLLRYFSWRFTVTVLPADDLSLQSIFVWALFAVEMVAWFDTTVGFLALSRRSDRRPEAALHEARLRTTPARDLPTIDVMIATYNESLEVLEKTIVGALALDWPRERLNVIILDDGRRAWLKEVCSELGAGYLTRADNRHAKAGNINAAITRTSGEFFLVLDADFVPQRNFLFRTVGFFADPNIGIVQIPHSFFNHDPMQTNLGMQRDMPDDQRFFFDAIMPGRDGWDCAFCCGSNGIIRRSAMQAIGNKLPTGSITEDMLLTLALLRKGFVTRYLNERLAVGLAPESLAAFFVQRARWARGAIQILFLREGPLGPGLSPIQRALFLPTHWISQSFSQVAVMATPAIYLLTGLMPLLNANVASVLEFQIPAVVGAIMTIRLFAPWQYHPIAATAHGVLQAFRLLPTVVVTLIKPHGHAFKVTPKGKDAGGGQVDGATLVITTSLILATALGLLLNANINTRIVEVGALVPVVAFWAIVNMVVLSIVAAIAVAPPSLRIAERFALAEPVRIRTETALITASTRDISMSGALLETDAYDQAVAVARPLPPASDGTLATGAWILVEIANVGQIPAQVMRCATGPNGAMLYGVIFHLPRSQVRDRLIRRLFTQGLDDTVKNAKTTRVTLQMLVKIFKGTGAAVAASQVRANPQPPAWLLDFDPSMHSVATLQKWAADRGDETTDPENDRSAEQASSAA